MVASSRRRGDCVRCRTPCQPSPRDSVYRADDRALFHCDRHLGRLLGFALGPHRLDFATPITVGLLVIGRHIEGLRFLHVLLGNEAVLTADHAFYQRLLAGDTMEAIEAAQTEKSPKGLQTFLESVAIPALRLAQADAARGVLSKNGANELAITFSDAIEEIWADVPVIESVQPPVIVVAQPVSSTLRRPSPSPPCWH